MRKKNYLASFLIAYLLCIGGLNQIIGTIMNKTDGVMIMNLTLVAGLLILQFFLSNKKRDLNMNKKALLFVYYITSIIVVYRYAYKHSSIPYVNFIVYCFIPIYLSFYRIDVEKVLHFMMSFSVLILPISNEFFRSRGYSYETIGMSTSYNVLPFVLAAAIHFIYYRKKAGFWLWMGYGINIYYLLKVIYLGNRGPIITLIVFALPVILHKLNPDGTIRKTPGKTMSVVLIAGIISILVISNIESIILSVYRWLQSMDIELAFITKSVMKINNGDLSNGRNTLFAFVMEGIKKHYLVGNGIASTYYNSYGNYSYPHNLFLQMWYDIGIIVSLPLLYLVGKTIKKTFFEFRISKDLMAILMLLFSLSIPRLCYSSEFWGNIPFWLLIMFTISPNIYEAPKDNVEIEESPRGVHLGDERELS